MSDPTTTETVKSGLEVMVPDEPAPGLPAPAPRGRLLAIGAALLVAGIVLLVVPPLQTGMAGMTQFGLMLLGAVLGLAGLGRLLHGLRGRRVDVLQGLAVVWLTLLIGSALLAPWLPLAESSDATAALQNPIYTPPLEVAAHPLGTNVAGLDLLGRAIFGARTSLTVALAAVIIGMGVGGAIGLISGFLRGGFDRTVGILTNSILAVPPLILLIALATALESNTRNVALALSLLTIPGMIRLARANTIAVAQREFVYAARAMGATPIRVMLRELTPNVVAPLLSMGLVSISALIVAESSLSFLGLGVQQPKPTWGNMISEAQAGTTMMDHPFIVIVPGMFLFLTVFSFNILGEKAQARDSRSVEL